MTHRAYEFNERLRYADSHEQLLALAYRALFPEARFFAKNDTDNPAQRLGCDRVLALSNGDLVSIDEKIRAMNYPQDILLEWLSNDRTGAPGWVCAEKNIQYLNNVYVPHRIGALIGWPLLRKAWQIHGERWKSLYRNISADNKSESGRLIYTTRSVAVPTKKLIECGVLVQVYSIPFPATERALPASAAIPRPPKQGRLF